MSATGATVVARGVHIAGSPRDGRTARALWIWALLIAASFAAGAILHALGALTIDHLPPLHAHFRAPTPALLPAAAFGGAAVLFLPALAARLGFGRALLVSYGCALAWTVLLSISAGGPAAPLTHPQEYPAVLPTVGDDPLSWLASFTRHLPDYPTHVRGHPPLPVLVLWSMAALGLSGPLWAALLVVAVGCSATVAIALTVRELGGERAARRALPYLALTPASVWIATSMDAFFAGVGAWGVALLALSGRGRIARRFGWGAGAGVLLGALPYLSYGLVPYLLIPVVVAVAARVPREAVLAALAGAAVVTAAFATAGFLWPAGVLATHAEWAADPGAARPYPYFLFANLGVLAMLTGPATAVGLARPGPGGARAVVAAALVAVLALDVSGVTRGEVERIWVPYALWIGLAASLAPGRRWLAAQIVTGLLLQGLVLSPW
ncbi:hypothetical protein [Streptosporangium sp. V21-05]|uniref:hypothetical protein n=1 Tax=Streptosporangium sp. V21-05 TaxID=3446115 RepID=UPI003F5366A1